MKIKVAIIDSIGSHGSSHHYYLFAQAKGLIENKVDVTIFSNKKTYLSSSAKIKSGFIAIALAIATRCCSPPDN